MADVLTQKTTARVGYGTLRDVVLVHRNEVTGLVDFQFALGWVKVSSQITVSELFRTDDNGLETGIGIYKLTGQVNIAQNDAVTVNQLHRYAGERMEMHMLLANSQCLSFPYVDANGNTLDYSGFYSYIADRYPFIDRFRDQFGVRMVLEHGLGGVNHEHRLKFQGMTADFVGVDTATDEEFYSRFPGLDRGL